MSLPFNHLPYFKLLVNLNLILITLKLVGFKIKITCGCCGKWNVHLHSYWQIVWRCPGNGVMNKIFHFFFHPFKLLPLKNRNKTISDNLIVPYFWFIWSDKALNFEQTILNWLLSKQYLNLRILVCSTFLLIWFWSLTFKVQISN